MSTVSSFAWQRTQGSVDSFTVVFNIGVLLLWFPRRVSFFMTFDESTAPADRHVYRAEHLRVAHVADEVEAHWLPTSASILQRSSAINSMPTSRNWISLGR